MDIKDFILIGGGILIAAVVAHGFWIAWRERRRDLRFDIQPDLIPSPIDDMERLRGELPNGGARVSRMRMDEPQQVVLDLREPPPLLLEPSEGPPARHGGGSYRTRSEPRLESAVPAGRPTAPEEGALRADASGRTPLSSRTPVSSRTPAATSRGDSHRTGAAVRAKVSDVSLPDPLLADQPGRPRRLSQRREPERVTDKPEVTVPEMEELFILNVLAASGSPYTGDGLFAVLRGEGLKFGDMNIFHRLEPLTKIVNYSIANVVEPGTFDMSEMESVRSPGLCLFMQLPGPQKPLEAFEDMLNVARTMCRTLGGEIKDEQRNVMTPQTVEHYRQRILDYSRRRMSKRA